MNWKGVGERWSSEEIAALPDTSFLLVVKGESEEDTQRHYPVKKEDGSVDENMLVRAIAELNSATGKKEEHHDQLMRIATSMVLEHNVELKNFFLDPVNCEFPVFGEYMAETLLRFNRGEPKDMKYTAEAIQTWGRDLASYMRKTVTTSVSSSEYDEDGNVENSTYSSDSDSETTWRYHDGLVQKIRTKDKWSTDSDYEFSFESPEAEEAFIGEVIETLSEGAAGDVLRALRKKQGVSRESMARRTKLSVAQIRDMEEAESADELDSDDLKVFARAIGITPSKLENALDELVEEETEEVSEGLIEIVSDTLEIVAAESAPAIIITPVQEPQDFPVMMERLEIQKVPGYHKEQVVHSLTGMFDFEALKASKKGTVKFESPAD